MGRRCVGALGMVLGLAPLAGLAQDACGPQSLDRPRIGLALGGGGARGAAHIGVLEVLQSMQVPIDAIAGTSMGAIVGGLYASGMEVDAIAEVLDRIEWPDLFSDQPARVERSLRRKGDDDLALFGPKIGYRDGQFILPEGALVGQKLDLLFARLTLGSGHRRNFDWLPIPFRAVATDIVTAEPVILGSGSLARAMRASMSIPGLLAPVASADKVLVDGGITNNLPINVLQETMQVDVVIAVDVSGALIPREEIKDIFSVLDQMTTIMVGASSKLQIQRLTSNDILIRPDLGQLLAGDFEQATSAVSKGAIAARRQGDRLSQLALSSADYRSYRQRLAACRQAVPTQIDFVQIENRSLYNDEVIQSRLNQRAGQALNIDQLEKDLSRIYGVGNLRQARYEIIQQDDQSGLLVQVESQRRAPNYIEFGFDLSGDGSDNRLNAKVGYLKTAIDDIGTEWRSVVQLGSEPALFSELYKPFSAASPYFLRPSLSVTRQRVGIFDGREDPLAQLRVTEATLELAAGKQFGNTADTVLGLRLGQGKTAIDIGDPALPTPDFDLGTVFLNAHYDDLDDAFIPTRGRFAAIELRGAVRELGAEDDYQQIALDYFSAHTWYMRHSWVFGARMGTTLNQNAPVQALFRAGGFTRLSGFEFNQLSGQHFGMLLANYRYRIGNSGLLPAYIGTGLELGNTWDRRSQIGLGSALFNANLYFAYRSPLGPIYLGYGMAEGGHDSFFVNIGGGFRDTNL